MNVTEHVPSTVSTKTKVQHLAKYFRLGTVDQLVVFAHILISENKVNVTEPRANEDSLVKPFFEKQQHMLDLAG